MLDSFMACCECCNAGPPGCCQTKAHKIHPTFRASGGLLQSLGDDIRLAMLKASQAAQFLEVWVSRGLVYEENGCCSLRRTVPLKQV